MNLPKVEISLKFPASRKSMLNTMSLWAEDGCLNSTE
ncbi:hypothetical protein LEMLEM_LOCUS15093, partial [Lemmus lemmus]